MLSLNVNGLGQLNKRREIFRYVKSKLPQIVLFQETYSSKEIETVWSNEWGSRIYFSHGKSNSRGVATLFTKKFFNEGNSVEGYWNDDEGRFLAIECVLQGKRILIVNIYAPNEDDPAFFVKLFGFLDKDNLNFEEMMVNGDFNTTLDPNDDKRSNSTTDHHGRKRQVLLEAMEQLGLVDIWRTLHPNTFQFTFRRMEPYVSLSRIDYMLITTGLVQAVRGCRIIPRYMTDHSMLEIEYNLDEHPRGPGYWKLNNTFLSDKDFLESINKTIDEYFINIDNSGQTHTPDVTWEALKALLIAEAKNFSIRKAKGRNNLMELLQHKLLKLDEKLAQGIHTDKIKRDIRRTEQFLMDEYEQVTQSAIFRSKSQFYAEGDKPTQYFFNLEKSRARGRAITLLKGEDDSDIADPKLILKEIRLYYKKLYSTRNLTDCGKVDKLKHIDNAPRLTEELKMVMDLPISNDEISMALKSMPNNKCPGNDGLSTEFYKMFWLKLKDHYCNAIQYAIANGCLHQSARMGIISLLPKKDKDTRYLKNARPLTLMNVDYKIYSKVLSLRLKEVLPYIIHDDQTGFMSGRDISLNIRKVLDIIQYTEINKIGAVVITIDYAKAFDSIEYEFIWNAMKYFNFGSVFIDYVKILFKESMARVINNGWLSEFIYPTRSTKQGCSTSPAIFNICAELVAISIRNNPKIKGIKINEIEYKLAQFADDMNLFLEFDRITLQELVGTFGVYQCIAGLAVNYDKTYIYRIGSLRNSCAKLYTGKPFVWTNAPIVILGVVISHNMCDLQYLNFYSAFVKMANVCKLWGRRKLSLMGKVVINSLVASVLMHKMTVLDGLEDQYVVAYEKLLRDFLWDSKKPKIALNTLYNNKKLGGLGLIDIRGRDMAIKTQWVAKCKRFEQIHNLATYFLGDKDIWRLHIASKDVRKIKSVSSFWQQVLKCWACFTTDKIISRGINNMPNTIRKMYIKWNSSIVVGHSMLSAKQCDYFGISLVEHLISTINVDNWLSLPEMRTLCNNHGNKIFLLQSIICALPNHYLEILRGHRGNDGGAESRRLNYNYGNIPFKITRLVYQDLVHKELSHGLLAAKWSTKIHADISAEDLDTAFSNINLLASNTKLRDFQYRFLHRRIFTNKMLYRWGLVDSERCYLCLDEYETIEHLFFDCQVIKRFWTQFFSWYECLTDTEVNLTAKELLLNQHLEGKITILDSFVLIAKQYIFRCKCTDRLPNFYNCKDEIFYICKIERRIAVINDRRKKFIKKWSILLK